MLFGDPGMVRKIDKITGNISRVAGNGLTFFSGDGGPALSAGLSAASVFTDKHNNIFIVDKNSFRIRKVTGITVIEDKYTITSKIYPNPSSGQLNIICNSIIKTLFIRNAAGIVVSSQIIDDKIAHPDISSQPNGIYLVTLTTDKDTEFQKIILIH